MTKLYVLTVTRTDDFTTQKLTPEHVSETLKTFVHSTTPVPQIATSQVG